MRDLDALPDDLPVPQDDDACDHLASLSLPSIPLAATNGPDVDLSALPCMVVIYCFPRTGRPDQPLPTGWDAIPGARGCTPQSRAFRDHHAEITALGGTLYGLSTQATGYQQEMAARLHLSFPVLSDAALRFTEALRLPTFEVDGMTLLRSLTLVAEDGVIRKVFYPVFPPQDNPDQVIAWLQARN